MNVEARLKALESRYYSGGMAPGVSLILGDKNGWRLLFSLWDGVAGSGGKTIESIHDSEDGARAEYDRLLVKYRNGAGEAKLVVVDV